MQFHICRLCESTKMQSVLNLGAQVFTGIFPQSPSQKTPIGELHLISCSSCSLVQLNESFDGTLMYGDNYGYQSSLNESMKNHLERVSNYLKTKVPLKKDDVIVDIGSNDGTFLTFFSNGDLVRVGVDPTISKFSHKYEKSILKVAEFFDQRALKNSGIEKVKLITSISMMYDLENPISFARDIYESLEEDGFWFFEQSYLGLMIEKLAYDTICHEHIEYYSAATISIILEKSGFVVEDVDLNDVNGGSIAVLARKKRGVSDRNCQNFQELVFKETSSGMNTVSFLRDFSTKVRSHRVDLTNEVNNLIKSGRKVMALGASTKGNVLLQYCDLDSSKISKIGEVNKDKFGHFTPGTNIPIVPEEEVFSSNPDVLLILPWHFRETFIEKTKDFRRAGGKVLFPLPQIELL